MRPRVFHRVLALMDAAQVSDTCAPSSFHRGWILVSLFAATIVTSLFQ